MSKNDNGTATYIFQLKGVYPSAVAPEGCHAITEVVGLMTVVDAARTAVVLGIPDENPGLYMARSPRYVDGWPLITGAMLEKELGNIAQDYTEVEDVAYEPVPVGELDYETVDVLLGMLAEDVSIEDCEPNDWYYFPTSAAGTTCWLEKHGVEVGDVFRRVDAVAV